MRKAATSMTTDSDGIILPQDALLEFTSIYKDMPRAEALAELEITAPEFCDIIAGRRPLRRHILNKMKLRKVLAYERVDGKEAK